MDITFPKETYEAIRKAGAKSPALQEKDIYREKIVDSRVIEESDFDLIKKVVEERGFDEFIEGKRILRKIANIQKLADGGTKNMKIKRLDMLSEAIFALMKDLSHKWIFMSRDAGPPLPYFVKSVKVETPHRGGEPYVRMDILAFSRGKKLEDSIYFRRNDLGKTVEQILFSKGVMPETEDLVTEHAADVERYHIVAPRTGEQYLATGMATTAGESRWRRDRINMQIEGRPAKIVLDDREEYGGEKGEESTRHATSFWALGGGGG